MLRYVLIFGFVWTAPALAQPTHEHRDKSFPSHQGDAQVDQLIKDTTTLYDKAAAELRTFTEKGRGRNRLTPADFKALTSLKIAVRRISRNARVLQIWRETAGIDFARRANWLDADVSKLITDARSSPAGQQLTAQFARQLPALQALRDKQLNVVAELLDKGKLVQAETEFYATCERFDGDALFAATEEFFRPINSTATAVDSTTARARFVDANAFLAKARDSEVYDFAKLIEDIQKKAGQLRTDGAVTIDNASLTGPKLWEHCGQRWVREHVSHIRREVRDAIAQSTTDVSYLLNPTNNTMEIDESGFVVPLLTALAEIIDATTARATPDEVPGLYQEFLKSINTLVPHTSQLLLVTHLTPSLKKLAAKSPQFGPEVLAHHEATDELLRWRGRTAAALAQVRAAKLDPLPVHLPKWTLSGGGKQGLFPEQNQNHLPSLQASGPQVMPSVCQRLLGQEVLLLDVVAVQRGKSGFARYARGTYGQIATPRNLDASIAALKADLQVTDSTPPLSLAAALAIETAERGDFASVGGAVTGVQLDSMFTRLATLTEKQAMLFPLGTQPTHQCNSLPMARVIVRYVVQPRWVRHEHFFLDVPPEALASR